MNTSNNEAAEVPAKEGTVRGNSAVTKLVLDEASSVPDELYYSVLPMVAVSRGSVSSLSTPWGRRGWYEKYRQYQDYLRDVRGGRRKPEPRPPIDSYKVTDSTPSPHQVSLVGLGLVLEAHLVLPRRPGSGQKLQDQGVWHPGKNAFATIWEACPLVTLAAHLK